MGREDREGYRKAFEIIYRDYYDRAFKKACLIAHDRALGEDVVHEAFVRLWRWMPRLSEVHNFPAWFDTVVTNAALDILKKKREVPLSSLDATLYDDSLNLATLSTHPEEGMLAGEEVALVHRALETLRPELRLIVILKYGEGLSGPQIAQMLGCPVGTVKSRLRRALDALRRLFGSIPERCKQVAGGSPKGGGVR